MTTLANALRKKSVGRVKTVYPTATEARWIVGSIDENGKMSVAPDPKLHSTQDEAVKEADRLAGLNLNVKKFVVLEYKSLHYFE